MNNNDDPLSSTSIENGADISIIALDAIPIVGGVLSSTASFFLEKKKNRSLNQFLIDISEKINSNTDRINQEFVKQEEFEDLVEDVISKASEARQKEKFEAYKNIFLNTILSPNPELDKAINYLNVVERLEPRHLIILKLLRDSRLYDQQMVMWLGEEVVLLQLYPIF